MVDKNIKDRTKIEIGTRTGNIFIMPGVLLTSVFIILSGWFPIEWGYIITPALLNLVGFVYVFTKAANISRQKGAKTFMLTLGTLKLIGISTLVAKITLPILVALTYLKVGSFTWGLVYIMLGIIIFELLLPLIIQLLLLPLLVFIGATYEVLKIVGFDTILGIIAVILFGGLGLVGIAIVDIATLLIFEESEAFEKERKDVQMVIKRQYDTVGIIVLLGIIFHLYFFQGILFL